MNVIGISGSLNAISRASALAEHVLTQLSTHHGARTELLNLVNLAGELIHGVELKNLPDGVRHAIAKLQSADVVVIASPIYKASYTGLLKHFFDLVEPKVLAGKIAVLAATGGSPHHASVLEYQMRPLASFFRMWTAPTAIYAQDNDFARTADGKAYELITPETISRIDCAAKEAARLNEGMRHLVEAN